jgi:hypothetical protein
MLDQDVNVDGRIVSLVNIVTKLNAFVYAAIELKEVIISVYAILRNIEEIIII